ncbi:hypothetical protein BH23CHL5_BH23CHL5_24640 [soil metagenome]
MNAVRPNQRFRFNLVVMLLLVVGPVMELGADQLGFEFARTSGLGVMAATMPDLPERVVEALYQAFAVGSIVEVVDPDLYLRSAPGFSSSVLTRMALGTQDRDGRPCECERAELVSDQNSVIWIGLGSRSVPSGGRWRISAADANAHSDDGFGFCHWQCRRADH